MPIGIIILLLCLFFSFQSSPLVINEYLADPPDGLSGDANGDGVRDSTQDEFVELVNSGPSPLAVGGFTISDASQARFTIPAGKVIPPGEAAVIFGGGAPAGAFGNAKANGLVFAIGGAGLSLNNGGDSIIIKNNLGIEVARRDYPAAEGNANQSITRSPDVTGNFVAHSSAAGSEGRLFSPGTRVSGRPFVSTDPAIDSISPSSIVAGPGAVTITILGENFQSGAQARVNGAPLNTTFLGATELKTDLPPAVTNAPGTYTVTVENPDLVISNSAVLTVLGQLGINEFLADPPDGAAGDANGDGMRDSSQDEFIEIVNRTGAAINIGGFTLGDADQVRFAFPPGTMLPAGEAAIVFGGGGPRGQFGNAGLNGLVFTATLSLGNGGDTVTLRDVSSRAVESVAYGAAEGSANQSINRNPDLLGASLAPHSTISGSGGRLFSPGAGVNGLPLSTAPRIAEIIPDRVAFNSPPFSLALRGSGFESGATVLIDSEALSTTFLSDGGLEALVPSRITALAGSHSVEVRNQSGNRSNKVALVVTGLPPVLISVSPRAVLMSSEASTITLSGKNFDPSCVAVIEGAVVAATFISAREVKVVVPGASTAVVGNRRIRVRNGDGFESNELTFEVVPSLRITSVSPLQVVAGGPAFTLKVLGENFKPAAAVLLGQNSLPTKQISTTELQAEVAASFFTSIGPRVVRAQNPDGAISNEAFFLVTGPLPVISRVEPPSVIEGSEATTIIVLGQNFAPGAKLRADDQRDLVTAVDAEFISSERIEARLPALLTQTAGRLLLRVENPDFGVSNSVLLNISISAPLVINEYLADPPDGLVGDANGDGERSAAQDEFIEIVNRTNAAIDISGYRLMDSEAVRHVFAVGTVLPALEAAVVFGGGQPAGRFGNAAENSLVFRASSGGLSLNNGGDTIRLEDGSSRVVQEIKFGPDEGGANQAVNRDPDRDGAAFALHTQVAGSATRLFSPGTDPRGNPFTIMPSIAALSPASARAGSGGLLLEVSGANFLPGAVVLFGQTPLDTVYQSGGALQSRIVAPLVAEGGAVEVRVRNPGGETSASARFLIVDDPPRIISISPEKTGTGAGSLAVTISGERFQPGAAVKVDDKTVDTRFVSRASLVAVLPGDLFGRAAELEVKVLNADGSLSNAASLLVENGPLITRLPRSRIRAGSGAVEMAVGGLAFKPGITLLVDDTPVMTSFVSETAINVRLPAELTATPRLLTLQARNPDGGRSNRVTIRVVK